MTYGSARSRRRALRRGISEFPAVLGSVRPGIRFTATITAHLVTEPSGHYDPDALSDRVRLGLRAAAADAVRRMDPCDLPAAQDACTRNLRDARCIDSGTGLEVRAEARVILAPEDEEAVRALLAASRAQSIQEILARQRNEALAAELAHPAGVFAWWLQRTEADLAAGHPAREILEQVAEIMQNYPTAREEPLEVQLLEVLRDFLSTFTRDEQKRMLMSLLADSMRATRRPGYAQAVEALATAQPATVPAASNTQ